LCQVEIQRTGQGGSVGAVSAGSRTLLRWVSPYHGTTDFPNSASAGWTRGQDAQVSEHWERLKNNNKHHYAPFRAVRQLRPRTCLVYLLCHGLPRPKCADPVMQVSSGSRLGADPCHFVWQTKSEPTARGRIGVCTGIRLWGTGSPELDCCGRPEIAVSRPSLALQSPPSRRRRSTLRRGAIVNSRTDTT